MCVTNGNVHDLKMMRKNIENLPNQYKDMKLYGDKGYVGKNVHDEMLSQHRIKIITNPRKNQKHFHLNLTQQDATRLRYRKRC